WKHKSGIIVAYDSAETLRVHVGALVPRDAVQPRRIPIGCRHLIGHSHVGRAHTQGTGTGPDAQEVAAVLCVHKLSGYRGGEKREARNEKREREKRDARNEKRDAGSEMRDAGREMRDAGSEMRGVCLTRMFHSDIESH